MKRRKLKILYVCTGIFHLFTSVYLSSRLSEEEYGEDIERILVFRDIARKKVPIHEFADYFDKIIYQDFFEIKERPVRLIKRFINVGGLFPFSRIGKECYDRDAKYRVYTFDDYDLISNRIIQAVKKRKESIILVDEGMMLYSTNQYWLSAKRHKWLDFVMGIKIQGYVEHNHAIDTILCRYPEKLPDVKRAGRTIQKLPGIFSDAQWVSEMLELLQIETPIHAGKTALWLGDPLQELGMEERDEIEFIRRLAGILNGKYLLIVKPHPRDRQGKYDVLKSEVNIKILNMKPWIPVELIMSRLIPDVVLSAFSSATDFVLEINRNAKAIFCGKAMGIRRTLNKEIESMLQGNNKYYPGTLEEINKILQDE